MDIVADNIFNGSPSQPSTLTSFTSNPSDVDGNVSSSFEELDFVGFGSNENIDCSQVSNEDSGATTIHGGSVKV